MLWADVVTLIAEDPKAHGVFDPAEMKDRTVYCEVKSVSQNEVYQARAVGLSPEYRIRIPYSFEYRGEKRCIFRGVLYEIIRTYMDENDGIELTVQRVDGNAAMEAYEHV